MVNTQFVSPKNKQITTCKTTVLLTYKSFKRKLQESKTMKYNNFFLCLMNERRKKATKQQPFLALLWVVLAFCVKLFCPYLLMPTLLL